MLRVRAEMRASTTFFMTVRGSREGRANLYQTGRRARIVADRPADLSFGPVVPNQRPPPESSACPGEPRNRIDVISIEQFLGITGPEHSVRPDGELDGVHSEPVSLELQEGDEPAIR